MKFSKSFADIDLKETCTHILPDGVIVDVIYYPLPITEKNPTGDRYSVRVGNANMDQGKWFGNNYDKLDWFLQNRKIPGIEPKNVIECWIEQSGNNSTYYKS